jgi:transglutaminase-like putative cysteine protease
LLAAVGLGFAAQLGLRETQGMLRKLEGTLIARFAGGRGFEPKEHRTSLGYLGQLKLSGSIVLRVEAAGSPPPLLREASYSLLRSPYWTVPKPKQEFAALNSEIDLTTWKLLPQKVALKSVTVAGYLPGGQGLLAMPLGVATVEELPADDVQTNKLGVLNVVRGPGFVRFRAVYDEGPSIDSPPDKDDLEIPVIERPTVTQVAEELGLDRLPPEGAMTRVTRYFSDQFRYTIWQGRRRWPRSNETPLTEFLLRTRAGHCEHFATATAMLLRAAGIPTRYAVGYSVQEKKGDQWIVRERHGHAWCLAWVDGAWRDVDNTPAGWNEIESARASSWEKYSDAWSAIWFEFSKWRWGKGEWKRYVLWLLVPLLALAAWRLMTRRQWRRARPPGSAVGGVKRFGLDSELFLIERRLTGLGLDRGAGETFSAWFARLGRTGRIRTDELQALLNLHNRLRFDPAGLVDAERGRLRSEVEAWLRKEARGIGIGMNRGR